MEESNLRWVHTSRSWGDNHFHIRNSANLSSSSSSVSFDNALKIEDGRIGENQTEFSDHQFSQFSQIGHGFTELIKEIKIFHIFVQRIGSHIQSFLDDGVFTNK